MHQDPMKAFVYGLLGLAVGVAAIGLVGWLFYPSVEKFVYPFCKEKEILAYIAISFSFLLVFISAIRGGEKLDFIFYALSCLLSLLSLWVYSCVVLLSPHEFVIYVAIDAALMVLGYCFADFSLQKKEELCKISVKNNPDSIGREAMYAHVYESIRMGAENAESKAYAILGNWGSGKTHLLNYLHRRLSVPHAVERYDILKEHGKNCSGAFAICKIDVWNYSSEEELLKGIADAIIGMLSKKPSITYKRVFRLVEKLAELSGSNHAILINSILGVVFAKHEDEDGVYEKNISENIEDGERFVLLLDDIERSSLSIQLKLFPIIARLKKIKGLSIICSVAPEEMARQLLHRGINRETIIGSLYKIFDKCFSVDQLTLEEGHRFFRKLVLENYHQCKCLNAFVKKYRLPFRTPREVLMVCSHLAYCENNNFCFAETKSIPSFSTEKLHVNLAFLLETLRVINPSVLETLSREGVDFLQSIPRWLIKYGNQAGIFSIDIPDEPEQFNDYKIEAYANSYAKLQNDGLALYVIACIKRDFSIDNQCLNYHIYTQYIKCETVRFSDVKRICFSNLSTNCYTVRELIKNNAVPIPNNLELSIEKVFAYLLYKATKQPKKTRYIDALVKWVDAEERGKEYDLGGKHIGRRSARFRPSFLMRALYLGVKAQGWPSFDAAMNLCKSIVMKMNIFALSKSLCEFYKAERGIYAEEISEDPELMKKIQESPFYFDFREYVENVYIQLYLDSILKVAHKELLWNETVLPYRLYDKSFVPYKFVKKMFKEVNVRVKVDDGNILLYIKGALRIFNKPVKIRSKSGYNLNTRLVSGKSAKLLASIIESLEKDKLIEVINRDKDSNRCCRFFESVAAKICKDAEVLPDEDEFDTYKEGASRVYRILTSLTEECQEQLEEEELIARVIPTLPREFVESLESMLPVSAEQIADFDEAEETVVGE